MKQLIKILLLAALFMPQRIEALAQTSGEKVHLSRENRDAFSGTVGPRHAPSKCACPVTVFVLPEERRILLCGSEQMELSYSITSEDGSVVACDETVLENDESTIEITDAQSGLYYIRIEIGDEVFVGSFNIAM